MFSKNDVLRQQRRWAEAAGIDVDARGYVRKQSDNLRNPLSASALTELENGSELEPSATRPARMWALTSSAALVVNVFDHWRRASSAPLLHALGIDAQLSDLSLEAPFATGLDGDPPNVDVALRLASGTVVAIESKFTEWLTPRPRNRAAFKAKYFPTGAKLWARNGLPESQFLAEEIQRQ
ncbi:MAG TPA: hypothetical protein VJA26_13990, partial [Gammaproteobacteria bacterium]|nr:hypothetical protein [Gammaproteobacteria bacterium]